MNDNLWKPDLVVGTCEGTLFQDTEMTLVLAVMNKNQGNGDFGKWVKELERTSKGKRVVFAMPCPLVIEYLGKHGYIFKSRTGGHIKERLTSMEKRCKENEN